MRGRTQTKDIREKIAQGETCAYKTQSKRKLPNAELHSLYSSPNVIKVVNRRQRDEWDMWHAWGKEECIYGVGRNA